MNRGEIWVLELKRPDKPRPVLILTRQETIPLLHTITVAPLTRTLRGVPSEVVVGREDGLKETSAINLHHILTIPKSQLHRFVSSLSPVKMDEVLEAMLFALGFDNP